MLVLITYDVKVETAVDSRPVDSRRLRQVAKVCMNHGQRVQNSVFECLLDQAQFTRVRAMLLQIIDPQKDSLRFYLLGNHYKAKIEHYGIKSSYDPEGTLII